jgi:hypothetical protein
VGKPQIALEQAAEARRVFGCLTAFDAAATPFVTLLVEPRPARNHTKPFAVAQDHRTAIPVPVEPRGDLGIGHPRVSLRLRQFFEVGVEVGQEENHEGQAKRRQDHDADTTKYE